MAGGGDQAASAVGNGIVEPGIVSCTIGTSGVVFGHLKEPAYDPQGRVHTFCHAVEGAWHTMGVTQGAGLSLQWFRNQFAPGTNYDDLTWEAAGADAEGLYWLPYLMGERTPHLDRIRARRMERRHGEAHARRLDSRADRRRQLQPERLSGPGGGPRGRRSNPCACRAAERRARSGGRCSPTFSISEWCRSKRRKARLTERRCWRCQGAVAQSRDVQSG